MDVIGIGSLTVDIFTDSKFYITEYPHKKYVMFPLGKKRNGKVYIHTGGSSGNTISYLSKLGLKTGYFTKLGKDPLSDFLIKDLRRYGVNTNHIVRNGRLEAGRSLILISKMTKDTALIIDHGAASFLSKSDVKKNKKFLLSSKWVDISSFTSEKSIEAVEEIFRMRKNIFFTPSRTMISKFKKKVKKLINKSTLCAFNMEEFEALFGKFNDRNVKKLKTNCFITRGSMGISYFDHESGALYSSNGFKVSDVKNTTGAGDCAAAWFLYGTIKKWNAEKILKYASAAGAIHVQSKYIGAKNGNPTEDEILDFTKGKRFKVKKKIV